MWRMTSLGSRQRIISCRSLDVGLQRLGIYKRSSSASTLSECHKYRRGFDTRGNHELRLALTVLWIQELGGAQTSVTVAKRNQSAEDLVCDHCHGGDFKCRDSLERHRKIPAKCFDVLLEIVHEAREEF